MALSHVTSVYRVLHDVVRGISYMTQLPDCSSKGNKVFHHHLHETGHVTCSGLHSSTFRLNESDLCDIGGALRGCLGVVWVGLGGIGNMHSILSVRNGSG